jgi:hypothetical protein
VEVRLTEVDSKDEVVIIEKDEITHGLG